MIWNMAGLMHGFPHSIVSWHPVCGRREQDTGRLAEIVWVEPTQTNAMTTLDGDDLEAIRRTLLVERRRAFLFPLNDGQGGHGAHWTLFVHLPDNEGGQCLHFDSAPPSPECQDNPSHRQAYHLAKALKCPGFRRENCPRQNNTWDCGLQKVILAHTTEQAIINNEMEILARAVDIVTPPMVDNCKPSGGPPTIS